DYIRHTKKYGDFTIRPEFYINSNSTNPELSRGNNIALLHEYTNKKDFITETQFKIAPNVNIPTSIGLYSGEKSNRYYLTTENIKTTANSAFNTNINLASDRFFHQVYNLEFQNYLQSNFTYTNFNQTDRLYKLDATNYNPITEANKNTIPMYISSAVYNKTLTNPKKPYTITSENEVFNFYRVDGTSGVRTTTVLDATKQIQTKLLTIETNPNLRLTNYNYLNNVDVSNHAQRVVGDINAKFYKPFLYKVGSFVMQTKPILFIDYTTDYTNGVVSNEDSFANFVRDDNVFLRSRYNGIDLVDSGLKTAYGIDLYAQDSKNRKFQLFIAQRYNTEENLSNYVGRAGADLGKLNLSSRFIVDNKTQKFLFSNSNARFEPLSFLEVGLGYFYLDESLQNQEIANITTTENITYSAIIKYNKHRLFFDIIQNPSFIGENDVKTNKLIGISGGIGYESDCLLYRLGMQRRIIFTGTQNITINSVILEFKISQ
ncbi:MAG: hypothetical protein O3A66_02415, partial [Proteobacteria bacterium]|nr:hypothetical protein [Pseudomonadota bacterium]